MSTKNWTKEERETIAAFLVKQNPCLDNYHSWVRSGEDVLTFEEALYQDNPYDGTPGWCVYPDFTGADVEKALASGKMTVYSSYPIKAGTFVSVSRMEAEIYAGGPGKKVYSKLVSMDEVAWLDNTQGMFFGTVVTDKASRPETYQEMRDRQGKEISEFPQVIAFTQENFDKKLKVLGFDPEKDLNKFCHAGCGVYIQKKDAKAFKDMFRRHREERMAAMEADKTGEGFICEMFLTELIDHEYTYTCDVEDALDALGLDYETVRNDPKMSNALELACFKAIGHCD